MEKVSYTKDGTFIERNGEVFKVVGNLEVSKDSGMLVIPNEIVTKFLKETVQKLSTELKGEFTYSKTPEQTKLITVYIEDVDGFVNVLKIAIAREFSNFIEKETGKSCKRFFRNLTMFELSVQDNFLQIHWK